MKPTRLLGWSDLGLSTAQVRPTNATARTVRSNQSRRPFPSIEPLDGSIWLDRLRSIDRCRAWSLLPKQRNTVSDMADGALLPLLNYHPTCGGR